MGKHLILRSFIWTVIFTSFFVLTLSTMLVAYVVGDWIYFHTESALIAWTVGIFILIGFLATLGTGVGVLMWFRNSGESDSLDNRDTMTMVLRDSGVLDQD
jgi:hypothetical protein